MGSATFSKACTVGAGFTFFICNTTHKPRKVLPIPQNFFLEIILPILDNTPLLREGHLHL